MSPVDALLFYTILNGYPDLCLFDCCVKDSNSVVEWTQSSENKPHRPVDHQLSYETEWDMINAVSFRRKAQSHGEGKCLGSQLMKYK